MPISAIAELPAFSPLMLFGVLLALKMGAVAAVTSNERRKAHVVVNPEDVKVNPGSHSESAEVEAVLRAKRAHLNDVENIPLFLILATLFALAGSSATAGWAYFGMYFVARTLHTVFYLKAVQPWRTVMFFVGQLTQLGMMFQLLMLAF